MFKFIIFFKQKEQWFITDFVQYVCWQFYLKTTVYFMVVSFSQIIICMWICFKYFIFKRALYLILVFVFSNFYLLYPKFISFIWSIQIVWKHGSYYLSIVDKEYY